MTAGSFSWTVDADAVSELCASDEATDGLNAVARELAQRLNDTPAHVSSVGGSWTAEGRNVRTSSSFWHLEEYGTRHSPPYAPVRKAMDALDIGQEAP